MPDERGPDRVRRVLDGHIGAGLAPGLVALVRRGAETRAVVLGSMAAGGGAPMRRDALFRVLSLTKPVTAVAALSLVEDGTLALDDPVDRWVPELAGPRVLRRPDGPLDDTVPAARAITVRDLLTFRLGTGAMTEPCPLGDAMAAAGVAPGPDPTELAPGEWLGRLGALPLAYQPGARWLYDTGSDVLGVLLARAADRPLADLFRERVFEPLGMRDTGFHVPSGEAHRLAASYRPPDGSGVLTPRDDPRDRPPAFPSGAGGLVSTADDYVTFFRTLLDGGGPVLSRESVAAMTTDRLRAAEKAGAGMFLQSGGWGFGVAVETRDDPPESRAGRFGWMGGLGTMAFADPSADLVAVLFTQVELGSPESARVFDEFREVAYAPAE
ncbi:serine hydrolase [Actinomadura sp. WMMB 499]|uniref:serine hydrolase domain-containing protein n=1 Tax=Actinomadura sp. WMMB 499 TaxID=1219491 RepID=UPI001246F7A5|nr:serine hydrolase domain-containing protein [Actinomadura sp. WMMB 499]QFG24171.1 beta-lactamase family protein [Actinomadura sp. WMMB 499]